MPIAASYRRADLITNVSTRCACTARSCGSPRSESFEERLRSCVWSTCMQRIDFPASWLSTVEEETAKHRTTKNVDHTTMCWAGAHHAFSSSLCSCCFFIHDTCTSQEHESFRTWGFLFTVSSQCQGTMHAPICARSAVCFNGEEKLTNQAHL